MNRYIYSMLVVFLCLLASVVVRTERPLINNEEVLKGQSIADTSVDAREPAQHRVVTAYGKLPLSFEANQGQTDEQVKFLSRGKGYTLFLTPTEAVLALRKNPEQEAQPSELPTLPGDREEGTPRGNPGGTGVPPVASGSHFTEPAVLRINFLVRIPSLV